MTNPTEKTLLWVAAGFLFLAACVALLLIGHLLHPHLPAIRAFLLWACDPRLAMGMGLGLIIGAGIAWCLLADERRPVEDLL